MVIVPAKVPLVGGVVSTILQMSTFGVLCFCLTRRTQWIKKWSSLPLAQWLILIIYVDSALFVFTTSIIVHGFGINSSSQVCEGGILLCLVCYMTTKILIYYFLVERAYIVGGSRKPRIKTKLWLFNCLFMILPYTIFVIMNFIFRITYINDKGVCIIGMQKIAMLPLIVFEVIVNVYLTLLFIVPLRGLHSYKTNANPALGRMAFRSFVGSCATLTTSVINLTILMVLHGEPGWICLMCCNADILFCVLVLHWVTSKEQKEEDSAFRSRTRDLKSGGGGGGTANGNMSSQLGRSRRVSTALEIDEIEKSGSLSKTGTMTISQSEYAARQNLTTIITECKATPGEIVRTRPRRSSWDANESNPGVRDDEVELHNIRVHTIQTREVEVDGEAESKRSVSMNTDGEGDDWVGSRRGVVGERMV